MIIACDSCGRQYNVKGYTPGQKARCLCGCVIAIPKEQAHDAPMRHCADCGGPLPQDANACEYCGGAVDRDRAKYTLVCPKCFARLPQNAKYCIECAVPIRPEQLDSVLVADAKCPRCKVALHGRVLESIQFHECPQCCGMWLSNDAFREVSQLKVKEFRENPLPDERAGPPRTLGPVVYLRCPVCDQLMHRANFGKKSGVIIDRCQSHGVWLDDQELERIARFIAEGGLARARQDEAEELERRARRARTSAEIGESVLMRPVHVGGGSFLGVLGRLLGE